MGSSFLPWGLPEHRQVQEVNLKGREGGLYSVFPDLEHDSWM